MACGGTKVTEKAKPTVDNKTVMTVDNKTVMNENTKKDEKIQKINDTVKHKQVKVKSDSNEPEQRFSKIKSVDTIPLKKKRITRTVEGKKMDFFLDGHYFWYSPEYYEKVKFIEEVKPGIVFYKKTIKSDYDGSKDKIPEKNGMVVPDKIEFFDKDYTLINSFDIDKNNPFLKNVPPDIRVRMQYFDAEDTEFLPKSQRTGKEIVKEYHLWTIMEFQDGYSKVLYEKYSVSDYGQILSATNNMVVLDTLGNQIFNHTCSEETSFPVISRDGKYAIFSILTIETTSNAGIKNHQEEGFEIWNIQRNKQIYSERNDDPNMRIGEPFITPNSGLLIINYYYPNSKEISKKEYAFDPKSKILYSRVFSTDEWKDISMNWKTKYKSFPNLIKIFDYKIKVLKDE